MTTPNLSLAERAEQLRKNSLHETVSPERRKEMLRVAKILEALARHKAKKAQEQAAEYPTVNPVPLAFAHLRDELHHAHMVALADMFDGWTQDERRTPEQTAMIMGWVDGLRNLADGVGPSWSPPEPERLSAIGFLARRLVRE